jgi:hypothetical protein
MEKEEENVEKSEMFSSRVADPYLVVTYGSGSSILG